MKNLIITTLLLSFPCYMVAQQSLPLFETDSSKVIALGVHGFMYGAYQLRIGTTYQKAFGVDIGIQRSQVISFGGSNFYVSNSFLFYPNESAVVNPKIGGELMFLGVSAGYQFNYYTDGNDRTTSNTVTLGVWLANRIKFNYAEHIFRKDENPFSQISHRTFTLIFGLDFKRI